MLDDRQFVIVHPTRFGYVANRPPGIEEKTLCLVCGDKQKKGSVFCPKHSGSYTQDRQSNFKGDVYRWAQDHPDFNGIRTINPCGNCDARVEREGDYLCRGCRDA